MTSLKLKAEESGVITLLDEKGELYGVIYKDMQSRKNVFYKCSEMSFSELSGLFDDNQGKLL